VLGKGKGKGKRRVVRLLPRLGLTGLVNSRQGDPGDGRGGVPHRDMRGAGHGQRDRASPIPSRSPGRRQPSATTTRSGGGGRGSRPPCPSRRGRRGSPTAPARHARLRRRPPPTSCPYSFQVPLDQVARLVVQSPLPRPEWFPVRLP